MSAINTPSSQQPLVTWNECRAAAAELVALFYQNSGTMSDVQARHNLAFPPTPVIVQEIMRIGNADRRRWVRTLELARWLQGEQ